MGLTIRLSVALLAAALVYAAIVFALADLFQQGHWTLVGFFFVAVVVGAASARRGSAGRRTAGPEDQARVEGALQRLALQADASLPRAVVERDEEPLSWTTALPSRQPAVHVTTGLLERLDDAQLEAVLAHELAHVVNRDALVMTLVAGAPVAFLRGTRRLLAQGPSRGWVLTVVGGLLFAPAIMLLLGISRIVSRHRELLADRDAAVLTGSPAAVAGALLALSGERGRDRDLRDVFHFLPARDPSGVRRLWATHPPLRDRVQRLQRMERALQDPC